ncbi:MAG: SRPBCC family protein [Myxococcota bacterium]
MRAMLCAELFCALLLPAPSRAAQPLQPLPEKTLLGLRDFAERGELALIESHKIGGLKQITLVAVIHAPPKRVWDTLTDTERYPEFVPNVVKNQTSKDTGAQRWVEFELEVPLFNLEGTNHYRFQPPAVMEVETVAGDLKTGRWRWELYPLGENATLAVEYAYSDIRELNWALRKMIRGNKNIEHGSVLSAATVFMKALKQRAESRVGRGPAARPDPKKATKIVLQSLRDGADSPDFAALDPLLDRGIVALVQSFPDGRLHQAVLFARTYAAKEKVYAVAGRPERYDDFMPNIEAAELLEESSDDLRYSMKVKGLFLSIDFEARMRRGDGWLRSDTTGGDLRNAHFAWEFVPQGSERTLTLHYINTDLRRNSWVIRQLIDREPFFEHGVNVATGLITINNVRGRAEGWLRPKKK